jgi:pimeloyl-ACP methyl ester carboxylesterase
MWYAIGKRYMIASQGASMSSFARVPVGSLSLALETFGEGPPLVFSHGLTDNRQQGRRLLAPLLDRFRLIAFDQRGHSDSTPLTDPALYNPQQMTADLAVIMDALIEQRAVLAGESMGSATALLFALRWPERVEKLLLVAPAFGDSPNPGRETVKQLGKGLSTAKDVEQTISAASSGTWREAGFSNEAMTCIAGYYRSHQPASIAVACNAVADWVILRNLDELAALRVPVHILAWEGDPVHPVPLARRMAQVIPDARLTVVPSAAVLFNDMALAGRTFAPTLAWDSVPPGV